MKFVPNLLFTLFKGLILGDFIIFGVFENNGTDIAF